MRYWLELCAGAGGAVGDSLEPGAGHRARGNRVCRRVRCGLAVDAGGLWPGAPHRAPERRGGSRVAYGLANVSRRRAGSVVQIVASGLGSCSAAAWPGGGDLLADWRRSLPSDLPNNFSGQYSPEEPNLSRSHDAHTISGAKDVPDGARAHQRHQRPASDAPNASESGRSFIELSRPDLVGGS